MKSFSFKTANMVLKDLNLEYAKSDLKELQTIYQCIHEMAKTVKDPKGEKAKEDYSVLIEDAIELNKQSVVVRERLKAIVAEIDAKKKTSVDPRRSFNPTVSPSTQRDAADRLELEKIIKELDKIVQNSQAIASAKFAEYQKAGNTEQVEINRMLDGTGRRVQSSIAEDESLHSKLLKVKDDEAKLKTTLMGEYEKDDKLTKFKDDFKRDQYAIKLSEEEKPKEDEKKDGPAVDASTTTKTYTKEELDAISKEQVAEALKDYESSDTKKKLDAIMLKEAIAPASSSSSDSGSSGGGGGLSGPGSATAPKAYDAQREKERAKWLERAKAAEEKAMRQAMLKDLKTGRSVKPAKIAGKSGAGAMSLRDLFQKNQGAGLAKDVNPKTADAGDQMLAFLDRGAGSPGAKDKYKSYYRMGQGPGDVNPKDLFRTKFDSLYEKARLKALTEGADSAYAGRYVDIFLLVRSIMDDYYKSGKLSETKEIVNPVDIRK